MNSLFTHHLDPDERTLQVTTAGDIVGAKAAALLPALFELLEALPRRSWERLRLDLTGAEKMDATGLNAIVALVREVQARQGRLQILVSNQDIHRALVFSQIDRQVDLRLV
jgi:anti-anti-sigma factor